MASKCYSTNSVFFVSLNNKLLPSDWKYWTMTDYGKRKKCLDEIRRLDWIALIDGYWLVNNDWLVDINWPDHLTCSSYSVSGKTPWEDLANKTSNFTHSTTSAVPYGRQRVKMCHIFCEQVMSTTGYLLALKPFRWVPISTITLFFVSLKFNFFWRLSTHMLDTKVLTPPFP